MERIMFSLSNNMTKESKKQPKNIFITFSNFIIAIFISLIFMSAFCLVYNYTGCHITNPDGATDYKWESRQYFSTMKEGFSWFRFDKNGYNNLDDSPFSENPITTLLIGSSHMEAVQIPKNKNTGSLLNNLTSKRVYNIGISGHGIFTCVSNLKSAIEVFNPKETVIIETGTVTLNEKSMQQVIEKNYPKIKSNDHGLIYLIQKTVPAIKSLYKSITEWKDVSKIKKPSPANMTPITLTDEYKAILNNFLMYAKESVGEQRLIIFYHPTAKLDDNGLFYDNNDKEFLNIFAASCKNNGIDFIDMTEDFSELYFRDYKFAHGFPNTAISTGHLNADGHRLIANKLFEAIKMETLTQ